MIKTFEGYNMKPIPDFGDVLHLKVEDITTILPYQKVYVMLDYHSNAQLFSYSKKELFDITAEHLNDSIENGKVIYCDVEEIFETNPQLVVNLYKEMKKLLHKGEQILPQPNPYIDMFKRVHNLWMSKIPELKIYLEADTYNL